MAKRAWECKNGTEILGIYPITTNYEPYYIWNRNRIQITYKFYFGNGLNTSDLDEAKNQLLERDHKNIHKLSLENYKPGLLGTYLVPPVFLTKIPEVLSYADFPQKIEKALAKGNETPKDFEATGEIKSDITERQVFEAFEKYYQNTNQDCLILHSHYFLHGNSVSEKDFIGQVSLQRSLLFSKLADRWPMNYFCFLSANVSFVLLISADFS